VIAAKRPFAHLLEPRDDLHLALRAKHRCVEMLLHLAHFERHGGTLVQERDELRVERIDAFAQRYES